MRIEGGQGIYVRNGMCFYLQAFAHICARKCNGCFLDTTFSGGVRELHFSLQENCIFNVCTHTFLQQVYVWSRTYEGHEINFMELFTMRSELMPWFLALQVNRAAVAFFGLCACSHLYRGCGDAAQVKATIQNVEWIQLRF